MFRYYYLLFVLVSSCMVNSPSFLTEATELPDVKIQPRKALSIADTHLAQHGTFIWKKQENLKTHIVQKGRYYYVKRSDFPAKSAKWYLHACIRIDSQTGEVTYIE